MIQIVLELEDVSSRPPHCRDGVVAVPSKPAEGSPKYNSTHGIAVETSRSSGAVAGALTLGVSSYREKNALHLLFIGARYTLTVKK